MAELSSRGLTMAVCNARREGKVSSPLWDRLVFSKIAAKLGARVRLIISGSAPISADVKDFLRMYLVLIYFLVRCICYIYYFVLITDINC